MSSPDTKQEKRNDLLYFSSINLSKTHIQKNRAETHVTIKKIHGNTKKFTLMITYKEPLTSHDIPLLNLAFCMPLLNYGLFTQQFALDFPLNHADLTLLTELNTIFNKDILVNKIIKNKTPYFLTEKLPKINKTNLNNTPLKTPIKPSKITEDEQITENMEQHTCGVLSSGGKESLLTYCILKEMGYTVYPLYVNESGGHWRTALSAYRYHKKTEPNTQRIWTNVDRFYNFMLDNLEFIRPDHRELQGEAYPIRTCIFPYYVFSLLPLFVKNGIGNLLIGSEFDDLDTNSHYNGIPHYYGVFDQHQDYDTIMNTWYQQRIPDLYQWSALRNITGLLVEKILFHRYHNYAKYQRSCHSCYYENNKIVQCGKCSKCMNILLFLVVNNIDPKIMNFKEEDIQMYAQRLQANNLKLDHDEKHPSFTLIDTSGIYPQIKPVDHIEKFHIHPDTCNPALLPKHIAEKLIPILEQYTTGRCEYINNTWLDIIEKKI